MKLFCLPYAGGNASIYHTWKSELPENIEVIPIELPGRGIRLNEPLIIEFSYLVEDILQTILSNLNTEEEFQLFGHSLGGLLAYSVANKLEKQPFGKLNKLYLSGTRTPDSFKQEIFFPIQSKNELLRTLAKLGGIPQKFIENQEFMDYFLPIIKADFSVLQSYCRYKENGKPAVATFILNGDDDKTVNKFEKDWTCHLQKIEDIKRFKGEHFFINQYPKQICRFISHQIIESN